ncbi:chorismate mutase [Neobacillus sp. D3-1R]|uniref:chorismate mutase n=1 Tax=Neobacillus sp. D3-1R TaxID=3445778 RepID=UPI003F9F6E89
MIRGVRGATTVIHNDETEILSATEILLKEMISKNAIIPDHVASIFISVTDDITAVFPAKALRKFEGWAFVPVMCMREIPVQDSLKLCIRIMMHINTSNNQDEIHHVYLENAKQLRPDLQIHEKSI